MSTYKIYRHKKRPEIRYYVEMEPHLGGVRFYDPPGDLMPPIIEYLVHLKACRNVRFDSEDFLPEMAPEAGRWPYGQFMKLYELEE